MLIELRQRNSRPVADAALRPSDKQWSGNAAVRHALRLGAVSFDAVKHLLLCRIEKRPPKLDLDIYPLLPQARSPLPLPPAT